MTWRGQDFPIDQIPDLSWERSKKCRLLLIAGSLLTTISDQIRVTRWEWQREGPFADRWQGFRTVTDAPAPLSKLLFLSASSSKTP